MYVYTYGVCQGPVFFNLKVGSYTYSAKSTDCLPCYLASYLDIKAYFFINKHAKKFFVCICNLCVI